ncbi:DUF4124 domain-containing protein [Oceanospirillum maris]|uniref:DUF4124 domain-containing protein n=1 Tax=Oceanospirillum maris TaxID=64977 RepID=UPI000416674C|nr:DUF4124 domain-containing protein [Oceanospirillum maris]
MDITRLVSLVSGLLFGLSLYLGSSALNAGTFYHWIDHQGHSVYSDQPRHKVGRGGIMKANSLQPSRYRVQLSSLQTNDPKQRIIKLTISPPLAPADKAALYLNGKRYQSPIHSDHFLLHQMPNGVHSLSARIYRGNTRLPIETRYLKLLIPIAH